MNKFLVFILGIITGVVITTLSQYVSDEKDEQEKIEKFSNIQYFDVLGKNGEVTLHTYMPKDSVKILLGKPDNIDVYVLNDTRETWKFDFPGQGRYGASRTLIIEFENGELTKLINI